MDSPLIRVVQRAPTSVQAKLLAALLAAVVLVLVVGIVGLRTVADANDRAATLRLLQQRATVFRALQADVGQVRLLFGLRAGGPDLGSFVGQTPGTAPTGDALRSLDESIGTSLIRLASGGDIAELAVAPAPDEQIVLARIAMDQARLVDVVHRITAADVAGDTTSGARLQGQEAEPLVRDLEAATDGLVRGTTAATNDLIAANQSSLDGSRLVFILLAALSVALAFGLAFLLSGSIIRPIRRMESRLASIASGDFGGHVEVANRDELGALATNINRMNDELGRLYRELEAASRHKSEFLANMSHELRTPLNAIIGFSDVLHAEMAGPLNEKQRQYVEDVRDAGRHLLSLINDILDLSKVEAGRMELALSDVSVEDALATGLTMHQARATRNDIALHLSIEPGVGTIRADERKVRQVVFNLVSNAVKFTPAGGRIDIRATQHDGLVEISVADSGVGISAADQERIFEEFAQAGPAGAAREGTGLGLALARRFVELHGGRIWVQSEPGAGATFGFTLPVEVPG